MGAPSVTAALDSGPKKNHALTLSFSILSVSSSTFLESVVDLELHHVVAGARSLASKGALSLNIAKRMPAVFRASATAATFLPRLASMRDAHSQSGLAAAFLSRIVESATCTNSLRTFPLPVLVIRPRCCFS